MDILHEGCWFFDLFDNGNPHPHFRTFMHSFITHLWCTPFIPDSVLKIIKNTMLSLSPNSLQSRRERRQGKSSILALARGFKNYKSEKGSKNVMVYPCWDGIFGSSLLANPLAHMLVWEPGPMHRNENMVWRVCHNTKFLWFLLRSYYSYFGDVKMFFPIWKD